MLLNETQSVAIQQLVNESWNHAHQGRYYHLEADLFEHLMQTSQSVNVCHYSDGHLVGYAGGLPLQLKTPSGTVFRSAIGSLWSTAPNHRGKLIASAILTQFHKGCVEQELPAYLCYFKENDISRKIFKRFCDRNKFQHIEMDPLPIYQFHRSMPLGNGSGNLTIRAISETELSSLKQLINSGERAKLSLSRVYSELELASELSQHQGSVQWLGAYEQENLIAAFRIWRIRMGAENEYNFILQGAYFSDSPGHSMTDCILRLVRYAFDLGHLRILCPNPSYLDAQTIREVGLRNTYVKYVPLLVRATAQADWFEEIKAGTKCVAEVF